MPSPNNDDVGKESKGAFAPPRTGPRSTDPASRAAGEEVQARDTVRFDCHGGRAASIRTIESIYSNGSRSVVTATTDAATGNVTVEATKYPAPTFASVDGGIVSSKQNDESEETKRGTTSWEASGAAAMLPGPEEVPASDRLPVLGKVNPTDPDNEADRKIKMDSGLPEQVPATDRLPRAVDAASAQDREVREKSTSPPEKTEKTETAAAAPEEVPPTDPRSWHHFYHDVTSRVRWRGLARWKRRKNGGVTEGPPPSLDAVVPGGSSCRNDATASPDADPHDEESGHDDHERSTTPGRSSFRNDAAAAPGAYREGPDADAGDVISENTVVDVDDPTPLQAFAVGEQDRRIPPSDPNERRVHDESLVRRHLLEEAVEGYVIPTGTKTTGNRSKTLLECLKRHPKTVCAALLAVLTLILGATMMAVYVPRSSDDGNTQPEPNPKTEPPTVDPKTEPPTVDPKTKPPTVDPVVARYDAIQAVLGSVSEAEALSDELSPQGRALSWIAHTDPLQLPHDTEEDVRRLVQRYALATMYFAMGGGDGHWLKDYHFLEGIHECHWWNIAKPNRLKLTEEGAFCSGEGNNGTVTHVHMTPNNISGTLPDEMRYLSDLHAFLIFGNSLRSTIPNWLGNLTNLEYISLHSNELTGTIPESVGNLKKLINISLYDNNLSGTIPDSFAKIPVTAMLLHNNTLTGTLPESFKFPSNLKTLWLRRNSLNGTIPASWGEMSSLEGLSLEMNELTGHVPETLGNLGNLRQLYLSDNRLNGTLPSSLGGLKSLLKLVVYGNALTGTLPESFRFLSNLFLLGLYENSLHGTVPASWGEMSSLETLGLWSNELTGHLPETLGNLGNLELLYLFDNRLNGTLPSSLGGLKSLKTLNLRGNKFIGPIPSILGELKELKEVYLFNNALNGSIPLTLGKLTKLGM